MEVSGVVFQPLHSLSSAASADAAHVRRSCSLKPSFSGGILRLSSVKPKRSISNSRFFGVSANSTSGFCDNGHLEYYNGPTTTSTCSAAGRNDKEITSKKKKKTMKKKLKLLKGLSKNLSTFSDMGFGLDPDHGLADQVKGKMISEATELLLGQLQQLRAEEMELKRKKKEEKAKLETARMQKRMGCEDSSSSSSSSESSDSECGEVVDMSRLKRGTVASNGLQQPQAVISQEATTLAIPSTEIQVLGTNVAPCSSQISDHNCCSSNENCSSFPKDIEASAKRIEVCMGGKCKKSGAASLLEEFQKAVGGEGASVIGCKCMGKCRDGPNVRVTNAETEKISSNPLCIGVGLDDVGLIVSNFFGGNRQSELGFAQPAPS